MLRLTPCLVALYAVFSPTQWLKWLSRFATRIVQQSFARQPPLGNTIPSTLQICHKLLIFAHFPLICVFDSILRWNCQLHYNDLPTWWRPDHYFRSFVGGCYLRWELHSGLKASSHLLVSGLFFGSLESIWSCYGTWWQYIFQICWFFRRACNSSHQISSILPNLSGFVAHRKLIWEETAIVSALSTLCHSR